MAEDMIINGMYLAFVDDPQHLQIAGTRHGLLHLCSAIDSLSPANPSEMVQVEQFSPNDPGVLWLHLVQSMELTETVHQGLLELESVPPSNDVHATGNEAGLRYFLERLKTVARSGQHDHLWTAAWAGKELTEFGTALRGITIHMVTICILDRSTSLGPSRDATSSDQ